MLEKNIKMIAHFPNFKSNTEIIGTSSEFIQYLLFQHIRVGADCQVRRIYTSIPSSSSSLVYQLLEFWSFWVLVVQIGEEMILVDYFSP